MSDEKLLETLIKKVDGLADDVRSNSYKLDRLENRVETGFGQVNDSLDKLRSDFRVLSGQFNDVGSLAIKDSARIDELETRVEVLESGTH